MHDSNLGPDEEYECRRIIEIRAKNYRTGETRQIGHTESKWNGFFKAEQQAMVTGMIASPQFKAATSAIGTEKCETKSTP